MRGFKSFLNVLEEFGPMIAGSILPPKLKPLVPFVIHGIGEAKKAKGATGQQKLDLALEEVRTGVAALNAVRADSIDPTVVDDAMSHAVSATYDVIKLLHERSTTIPGELVEGDGDHTADSMGEGSATQ